MRIFRSIAAIALSGMLASGAANGESKIDQAERALYLSVNQARQAQGLPPLRWNQALAAAAIQHAQVMAERGTAQHGFEGEPDLRSRAKLAGVRFSSLSENVTQGPTPEFIHGQFMHSLPHRANILDSDMNSVGIGVVEKQGQLFAVEDFSRSE